MNHSSLAVVFRRQLRFWTFHCVINALPGFCIALVLLRLWQSPSGIAAMGCGIATFILLFASLTSLIGPLAIDGTVFSRALRAGAQARSFLAATGFITFFINLGVARLNIGSQAEKVFSLGYLPDLYCGIAANGLLNDVVRMIKPFVSGFPMGAATIGFMEIYLITVIEGFLLSLILLLISFFMAVFFHARDRNKRRSLGRSH